MNRLLPSMIIAIGLIAAAAILSIAGATSPGETVVSAFAGAMRICENGIVWIDGNTTNGLWLSGGELKCSINGTNGVVWKPE